MTSTRSNPRLGASPVALTSLGAVGGARGTAAGALRVFVEFLTTYDRAAISELENDLRQVDHAQDNSTKAEEKRQRRLTSVKNSLAEAERITRGKLNTELRSDLKRIEELEASRSKTNRAQAATERATFNQTAKSLGLTKQELDLLANRSKLQKEATTLTARQSTAEAGQLARAKQRAAIEQQIAKIQTTRASLAPKLSGLAIGAIGGIVGGAVLGVGFALADQAIQGIGDSLQDIIDPARHARDAIASLGDEVLKLAQEQDLTLIDAGIQKAQELGVAQQDGAAAALANFAAQKKASDAAKEYADFVTGAAHGEGLRDEAIKQLNKSLVEQAKAENDRIIAAKQANGENVANTQFLAQLPLQIRNVNGEIQTLINGENSLTTATKLWDEILGTNTATINANAGARQRLADASAFAKVQQDALTQALQNSSDAQTAGIDSRLEALSNAGPSARTKALQAAIDKASGASSGASNRAELQNIAEERQLILLRQRLRLLGTSINLEKYSGKFLLEAINAKTAAIQKEGAAQDRLNRLLDLQFRMSQQFRRQEGESIGDFVERRAQEQRAQLTEQRDLERDAQLARLDELRDQVQDEVALQELEERRKETLRQQGTSNHLKNLQKQLEASQKADKAALDSKRKALEAEKAAIQKKTKEAIELANDQAIEETLAALRGADSLEKLTIVAGRIAGLQRAKATIQGLVQGFGLPAFIAAPFLDNIDKALGAFESRKQHLIDRTPGRQHRDFASGGIIQLRNSRSPFGQNVHTGEEGDEIGVILSNKVASILKQDRGGVGQVGPFYVNRSEDPLRDKYMLKKIVKEALSETLR